MLVLAPRGEQVGLERDVNRRENQRLESDRSWKDYKDQELMLGNTYIDNDELSNAQQCIHSSV